MSLAEDSDEGTARPLPEPRLVKRRLLALSTALSALALLAFAAWRAYGGGNAVESPLLWAAITAFWGSAFCLVYLFEIDGVERTLARAGPVELTGVKVFWLPDTDARKFGASMEVRVRTTVDTLPREFSLFLNVDLVWSLHIHGVRSLWECKESGVLLLTPSASRFLGGATIESLSLPSQEVAALRGLLKQPGEPEGLPEWGAPAGLLARDQLKAAVDADWLFGPEQPFLALEAFEGRVEKFWPPVADRLVDLDVECALDLLRIVRAFDLDALAARRARPTSSPSSPPT